MNGRRSGPTGEKPLGITVLAAGVVGEKSGVTGASDLATISVRDVHPRVPPSCRPGRSSSPLTVYPSQYGPVESFVLAVAPVLLGVFWLVLDNAFEGEG